MKFGRRLRLYIFGVLMGSVLVLFFFNDRLHILTDWLPGNRVLTVLQNSEPLITDKALCQLACFDLDTADVRLAKQKGDVRFKLSETHDEPKKYVVDSNLDPGKVRMTFSIADSLATLINVALPEKAVICECD
ncbi:hypothetical protein G3O08_11285 [Cryomorpha ignava]|uniref:DUF4258 domain-containing protein n=1 Tax=Cryomorpha ignava TaxID=101383 RepID=A0A7K3WQX5_9FLAO|nr:hypothetical protein [Cryomorpha ignava]NEN24083.1 hypothetical protein [Cryomorpha ignava]